MTQDELGKPLCLEQSCLIVTGGASGVGLATAREFASDGAKVLLIGRSKDKLTEARLALEAEFPNNQIATLAADVTDPESAKLAMEKAAHELTSPAYILVNNAGTIFRSPAHQTNDDDWQSVMDINVNGPFYFSRAFVNQLVGDRSIVNVSSTCGQVGAAGLAAYCASKGALDQLTRSMALELGPQKINVNAVAPGAINSPMLYSKHEVGVQNQDVVNNNVASIPIGSIAEPSEVARAIKFLATQRHISGTILSVDGGYLAQ